MSFNPTGGAQQPPPANTPATTTAPLFNLGGTQPTGTNVFGAGATTTQPKLNFGAPTTAAPTTTTPAQPATTTAAPTFSLTQPTAQTGQPAAGTTQPTFNLTGASQPASQPVLPSQLPQAKEKPLALKSARFVLSKIQAHLQQANYQGLSAFLRSEPDLQKMLGQALLHYKGTSADSRKKLLDPAVPVKWNGKDTLSTRLANELVIKLCETLNLDELLAFELLETYFATSDQTRKTFVYLITIDQQIFQAESSIQQQSQIMVQNIQLMQQKLRNIETWKREFSSVSNQVYQDVQLVYLQERTSLLQCILALTSVKGASQQGVVQFVGDLITKEHLEKHLLQSLVRNAEQIETFKSFTCSLRDVTLGLQREELTIMHSLARLYLSSTVVPKTAALTQFINYQQGTRFSGLKLTPQNYQSDETLALNQRKITSLAVQLCFAFMSVHQLCKAAPEKNDNLKRYLTALGEKQQEFQDLSKLMEENIGVGDPVVSVIYLTWLNMVKTVLDLNLSKAFALPNLTPLFQGVNLIKHTEKLVSTQEAWMAFISDMKEVDQQFEEDSIAQTGGAVQSAEQRDELQLLLQDWLCLIFPYLKQHKLNPAIQIAQDVTFEVISMPGHLEHVWRQIEGNSGSLFGMVRQAQGPCTTLEIFENILVDPLEKDNFGRFLILLRALIGTKRQKYASHLVRLLQAIKVSSVASQQLLNRPPQMQQEANPDWSLMQYLICVFFSTNLEEGIQTDREVSEYMNLTALIARIIRQNYLLYLELNEQEALPLCRDLDLSHPGIEEPNPQDRFFYNEDVLRQFHPLLLHMFKAYNALISSVPPSQAVLAIKSLLRAFAAIYKNLPLQPEILGWMNAFIDQTGIPRITSFFTFNLHECDYPTNNYSITRAYLSIVEVIFNKDAKRDFSYYLSVDSRINLGESIGAKYLIHIYQTLLSNFGQFTFKDTKDFLKLYKSLLKVTDNLLSRFLDVLPTLKAPLMQRYPNYDETLRVISVILNAESTLEALLVNALMLEEGIVRGQSTGITNKFWVGHLKSSAVGRLEDSKTRGRVQKLVTQALRCLNTLVELTHMLASFDTLTQDEKVNVGPRMYNLSKLAVVQNIASLLKNPGQWELYSIALANSGSTQYSLFGIVQYYVKPHIHLCPFLTGLQSEAVRFVSLCCQLWATQPLGTRVSLESTLRVAGVPSQEARARYIQNLKHASKSLDKPLSLRYIATFLDLLIVATSTQGQWVSELLKEQDFSQLLIDAFIRKSLRQESKSDRQPENKAFAQQVECKLIIFLAELSNHRVGDAFFKKLSENDDFVKLYDNSVRPLAEDSVKQVVVDYSGAISHFRLDSDSIECANLARSLSHQSVCSSLVAIRYYMILLANEYQRDLHSQSVKKALRVFFENPRVSQGLNPSLSAQPYMQGLQELSALLQTISVDDRGRNMLRDLMQTVENNGGKLSQEQLDMMNSVACKVVASHECTIGLLNLEGMSLLTHLKRDPQPYKLIQGSKFGSFGPEFYVNTEELRLVARSYFYDDEQWLAEMQQTAAAYNMALSYAYAQQLFLVAHRDLILSVGKTRLRENVRHRELVLENHALATSLFNLVVQDDVKSMTGSMREGTQNRLAKMILEVARPLCMKYLKQDAVMTDINTLLAFDVALSEIELDYLGILLGALNSVSELDDFQNDTLRQLDLEVLVPLTKALPKVRSQQKFHAALAESAQGRQEVERRSAKLYITLVLQLFSLAVQVQLTIGSVQQMGGPAGTSEQDYMRVLADIVKIMQDGSNTFLIGLKIIEQGFGLLSPQNVSSFMKKQENPPIKAILSKYAQNTTTIEEKVRIMEFLVNYCRVEDGAEHLRQDGILKALSIGSLMNAMNEADFYLTETPTSEPKRNPLHILWCHTLLLIRTLNHMLLPLSQEHRRLIPTELSLIWHRLTALLGFGQALKELKFDSKALSLALYEEIELMTGIVGQYMEYADELQANDWDRFVEVKDKILFGVISLFTEERTVTQNSSTEQYLLRMTHDKMALGVMKHGAYSGLDLASDTLKVKIVFNTMSSLLNLNMLNEGKASRQDFINTWDPTARLQAKNTESKKSGYYAGDPYAAEFDTGQALTNISLATHSLLQALTRLGDNFKLWLGAEVHLSELYQSVFGLFRNDEWINSEYLGFNSFVGGHTFENVLEQYEQSLQMGYLSAAMLLKKLKEQYETSDFGGYQNILMNGQPINLKLINEHGDRIIDQSRSISAEVARSKKVKLSVDKGYHEKIEEFIRGLRENPYDYQGGFMSKSRSKFGASGFK